MHMSAAAHCLGILSGAAIGGALFPALGPTRAMVLNACFYAPLLAGLFEFKGARRKASGAQSAGGASRRSPMMRELHPIPAKMPANAVDRADARQRGHAHAPPPARWHQPAKDQDRPAPAPRGRPVRDLGRLRAHLILPDDGRPLELRGPSLPAGRPDGARFRGGTGAGSSAAETQTRSAWWHFAGKTSGIPPRLPHLWSLMARALLAIAPPLLPHNRRQQERAD